MIMKKSLLTNKVNLRNSLFVIFSLVALENDVAILCQPLKRMTNV